MIYTTISIVFSDSILALMTLDLFFPFQMFPTELLKGKTGIILGIQRTKKVNHDCTTYSTTYSILWTIILFFSKCSQAYASSEFPLLFVFKKEETISWTRTVI